MPQAATPLVERIARVLCGAEQSANAEGEERSAGSYVDSHWRNYQNQAMAVLHTMREPDERMASAGDTETWRRMVEAAIGDVK